MSTNKEMSAKIVALTECVRILRREITGLKDTAYGFQQEAGKYAEVARMEGLKAIRSEESVKRLTEERDRLSQSSTYFGEDARVKGQKVEEVESALSDKEIRLKQTQFQRDHLIQKVDLLRTRVERMKSDVWNISFLKSRIARIEAGETRFSQPVRPPWLPSGIHIHKSNIHSPLRYTGSITGRWTPQVPDLSGIVPLVPASIQDVEARILKAVTEMKKEVLNVVAWRTRNCPDPEKKVAAKKGRRIVDNKKRK